MANLLFGGFLGPSFWAPVPNLLGCRCPPAIAGLVVAIVIDAIDRVLRRWSTPHIGNEALDCCHIFLSMEPPITDSYAATSVSVVPLVLWVEAPLPHVHQGSELSRDFPRAGKPMLQIYSPSNLPHAAAAGRGLTGAKVRADYETRVPAVAMAQPLHFLPVRSEPGSSNNYKPAKPMTGNINELCFGRRAHTKTPARLGVSFLEVAGCYHRFLPALAAARPITLPRLSLNKRDGDKHSELLPSQIEAS